MQLEYPEVITNIDEMLEIFKAEEKTGTKFEKKIEECDKNITITEATETGIERRENVLNIKHQTTDSLELRRLRVAIKWNDTYPYTYEWLKDRLNNLLGRGNFALAYAKREKRIICLVGLKKKEMENEIWKLLDEIVPLNLEVLTGIRYNRWKTMKKHTWEQLKKYTWEQLHSSEKLEEDYEYKDVKL